MAGVRVSVVLLFDFVYPVHRRSIFLDGSDGQIKSLSGAFKCKLKLKT